MNDINVMIRNDACLWNNLGLNPRLISILCSLGYVEPTPIQEKAIPLILSGRNVLVVAPTGTGKTEAALIPVLSKLRELEMNPKGIRVVYITPLRALNRDIHYRMKRLIEMNGYTLMVRHGDTTQQGRRKFMATPPTIMVSTPESFGLLITVSKIQKHLKNIRWIIIDEIHELLDSKRGVEFFITIKRLERLIGRNPQLIALSATLSEKSIRRVSEALGGYPLLAIDPSYKKYNIKVEVTGSKNGFWPDLASIITGIASREGSTLVFVNTRQVAERLGVELGRRNKSSVGVHHGSLHRGIRERVEKEFKEGEIQILVSTSSMELGIDIGSVNRVVQVTSPRRATNLSQRIGRSGHLLGRLSKGYVITIPNIYEIIESVVIARRTKNGDLEDLPMYDKPLDTLAHGIAGFVLDSRPIRIDELYHYVSHLPFYRNLGLDEIVEITDFMENLRTLRKRERELTWGRRTRSYFYSVSMIPSEPDYTVIDISSREMIGKVSERFVVSNISREAPYFVLAGKIWRVLDIDTEKGKIYVMLQGVSEARIPSWEGELIPVEYKVAREVCGILQLILYDKKYALNLISKRYGEFLSENTRVKLYSLVEKLCRGSNSLSDLGYYKPVLEIIDGGVLLYTCLGSKGNYTLGLLISSIISRIEHVEYSRIPYSILFTSNMSAKALAKMIADSLRELSKTDLPELIGLFIDHVRNTYAYKIRLSWIAKRMGVISRDTRLSSETLRKLTQIYKGSVLEREVINEMLIENNDMNAVLDFLENLKTDSIKIIDNHQGKPTFLAQQTLENPYMRRPETGSGRQTMLKSLMIEAVKKRLENSEARMICLSCGYSWTIKPSDMNPSEYVKCPRCSSRLVAITWKGDEEAVHIIRKHLDKEKLTREEGKRLKDLQKVATLLLSYSAEGLGKYVIEALLARGIGPTILPRVVSKLVDYGEREFYRAIIEEERKFVENRKYWKT
ncbi:MAG: DEAD/DEAH box helicase [Desulfurococcales archaeon]|nr:DEAD/DEAH box helicase [Desulfurococcales archaeon]